MKRTKFITEINDTIVTQDFLYLRTLYTPIIGVNAVALYQLLCDYFEINKSNNVYHDLKDIALTLNLTEEEVILDRKKLEAIGLIRVYEKSDNVHFIIKLNKPLSPLEFKNNSLLYKDFINKQGEIMFERIFFSTKSKSLAKDEFVEVTTKYQDLFKIVREQAVVENTQVIHIPSVKSITEAKKGLTCEQFIYYLTTKRPSPLQSNTVNKLKEKGLSAIAVNEIVEYSFTINENKIVSNHVKTIGEDLIKKEIMASKDIAIELANAKDSRLGIAPSQTNEITPAADVEWDSLFDLLGGN